MSTASGHAADSKHLPALRHGAEAHSSTSVSQRPPLVPSRHAHVYSPAAPSLQLPPLRHGPLEHSSMSTSHRGPCQPSEQRHTDALTGTEALLPDSSHVAPFWHGVLAHSSTSMLHSSPTHPGSHTNFPSTHARSSGMHPLRGTHIPSHSMNARLDTAAHASVDAMHSSRVKHFSPHSIKVTFAHRAWSLRPAGHTHKKPFL